MIGAAVTLCLVLGAGLLLWHEEHDQVALWTTEESPIRRNARWVDRHFSTSFRYQSVILTADNVLTPQVLSFVSRTLVRLFRFSFYRGELTVGRCSSQF